MKRSTERRTHAGSFENRLVFFVGRPIRRAQRSAARNGDASGAIRRFPSAMAHTLGHDQRWRLTAVSFFVRSHRHACLRKALLVRLKQGDIVMRRVRRIDAAMTLSQIEFQFLLQDIGMKQKIWLADRPPELDAVLTAGKYRRTSSQKACACEGKGQKPIPHENLLID